MSKNNKLSLTIIKLYHVLWITFKKYIYIDRRDAESVLRENISSGNYIDENNQIFDSDDLCGYR